MTDALRSAQRRFALPFVDLRVTAGRFDGGALARGAGFGALRWVDRGAVVLIGVRRFAERGCAGVSAGGGSRAALRRRPFGAA